MSRILWTLALIVLVAASGALVAGVSSFIVLIAGAMLVVFAIALQFSVERAAYLAVCVFVLAITWNGIRIAGGAFANGFFVVATLAVLAYIARERPRVPFPGWLFGVGVGLALAVVIVVIVPPDPRMLNAGLVDLRQVLTEQGQVGSLMGRSDLLALAKIELVVIWIPVMLATIANTNPKILRLMDLWTIGALVNAAVGVLDYSGI